MIAVVLLALSTQDFTVTQDRVDALQKEVRPLVEKAAGRAFRKMPTLKISTPEAVARALAEEIAPQLKIQLPGRSEAELRSAAEKMSKVYSASLVGKYQPSENCVHILADNFKLLAETYKRPRVNTPEFLRAVVIHELVHALDEQEFRALSRFRELKTGDELSVLNAVVEGHAQHVLRAVLESERCPELFRDFEEQTTAEPPGLSEGEKLFVQMFVAEVRFAYVDGRKFFDELSGLGKRTYVADVFKTLPASKDVILHPERYYSAAPARAARDVKAILDAYLERHEGWQSQRVSTGELELRTAFGDFVPKAELDAVLPRLVSGQTLALGKANGMKALAILQMESGASATQMGELMGKLTRAKEARLKEGAIRISKCERQSLKTQGGVAYVHTRMVIVAGEETVQVSDAYAVVGDFILELLSSNSAVTEEEVGGHLDRIVGSLKEGK